MSGGLVGLSTALFLAQHGVRALVVEKHAGTALHPRARGFHPPTVELLAPTGVAYVAAALYVGPTSPSRHPQRHTVSAPAPSEVAKLQRVTLVTVIRQVLTDEVITRFSPCDATR